MLDRPAYEERLKRSTDGDLVRSLAAEEIARLAEEALDLGARAVALKLGDRGLYLRTSAEASISGRGAPAAPSAGAAASCGRRASAWRWWAP